MTLTDKYHLPKITLKQRLQKKRALLLFVLLACLGILACFTWLDKLTSSGPYNLTIYSPGLDLQIELFYRNKTILFSIPQMGISSKFAFWKLASLGKKYWLYLKITTFNILFLISALLIWKIIKKRRALIFSSREFLANNSPTRLIIISKWLMFIVFLLSIFPVSYFNLWWQKLPYVEQNISRSNLAAALHTFMINFMIDKGNRFFYASLFTIPRFVLKWTGITCFILFIMGVFRLPDKIRPRVNRGLDKLSGIRCKKRWIVFAGICVFIIANFISLADNLHLPAKVEDTAQFFQAQIFAAGKLTVPVDFSREFFEYPLLQMDTDWYSILPPGQSFLLALGYKLKMPWLINPLLGFLVVLALYMLVCKIYGQQTALLSVLFLIFSPLYLELSASYLSHLPFILFLLLGLLFYCYSLSGPGWFSPGLCGLCLGFAAITRPVITILIILPCIIYFIRQIVVYQTGNWLKFMLILAGMFVMLFLSVIYFQLLMGNPFGLVSGQKLSTWLTGGLRAPVESLFYLMNNLFTLNEKIWGGLIPAFFLILVWIWASPRLAGWDLILLWAVFFMLIKEFVVYNAGFGLANPLMITIPLLIILTARATIALPQALSKYGFSVLETKSLLVSGVILCCFIWGGYKIPNLLYPKDSYRHNLMEWIEAKNISNAVIFSGKKPFFETFAYNTPQLNNDIIFARHLGRYNYKLMQEFPNRSYYFYNMSENKLLPLETRKDPW